jgi:hypothetical protein
VAERVVQIAGETEPLLVSLLGRPALQLQPGLAFSIPLRLLEQAAGAHAVA